MLEGLVEHHSLQLWATDQAAIFDKVWEHIAFFQFFLNAQMENAEISWCIFDVVLSECYFLECQYSHIFQRTCFNLFSLIKKLSEALPWPQTADLLTQPQSSDAKVRLSSV